MFKEVVDFIQDIYSTKEFIPLHEPRFVGNEKAYLSQCIDSTYVSSSGEFVDRFESSICEFTGSKYAVSVVNGTSALHIALLVAGVKNNDLVLTQPLTFVATCNAISYLGADPIFIDVSKETLGLCPEKLEKFLSSECDVSEQGCIYRKTGQKISACVPMHTFGHPIQIKQVVTICNKYKIPVIEDASESLGSYFDDQHTGSFGVAGVFSFNGNKTITCGGGGIITFENLEMATYAKHLSTTAKVSHDWEYYHDQIGFNYRLPNLNAALACAQMEMLPSFLKAKRRLSSKYALFFSDRDDIQFITEPYGSISNYWLNGLLFADHETRNEFLTFTNRNQVMTRPIWNLMTDLPMFSSCIRGDLSEAKRLQRLVANIPSSVILDE